MGLLPANRTFCSKHDREIRIRRSRRCRSSDDEIRTPISRPGRADLPISAAKDLACHVGLCLPTVTTEFQFHRSRFILTKKFDSAGAQLLGPLVRNSLLLGKIARSRHDQSRLHGLEKRVETVFSRIILAVD